LPTGLTPHSLRRTFASILFAMGDPPPYVIAQLGHADPTVTLRFYAKVMDRRDGEPERLKALVRGNIETQKDRNRGLPATERAARRAQKARRIGHRGRVAQWESARFTRERSQVRNPPRPLGFWPPPYRQTPRHWPATAR